ncbi:MAG: FmdB family zinc ribbon protein [Planctomycetota bacterium]
MPTYDYRCNHCDHRFEAFQGITDEPLARCPECESDALQRLIGAGAGIIFKGSGFYATDYKRGGSSGGGSAADDSSDASGE